MSPQASSATAMEFFPGQFETAMARAEAVLRSMVLTPAPARTMSESAVARSISAALTLVERTTSTSAPVSARRSPSAVPSSFGS